MRITQVLRGPPVFRFWKEFGAGKDLKKRKGYFNQWQYLWNAYVRRMKIEDKTLPIDKLPPGARVMDAEDFLVGHIDLMPEQLMKIKAGEKVLYDYPWPYNVQIDKVREQEPIHFYKVTSRFFMPKDDVQNLAHTIIATESMEARPPIEPQSEHVDMVQQKIDLATHRDSVLVRLPKRRLYPKINLKPRAKYGVSDQRAESNVLKSIAHYAQATLAKHNFDNKEHFNRYLNLNYLSYPHCQVLIERESRPIGFRLNIDHMTVARDPLPIFNNLPEETESQELTDIQPRTWKSILEKTRNYSDDFSFKFPSGFYPRTIYLAARLLRDLPDDEMLARNIIHAFVLTNQLARQNNYQLPLTLQVISYKVKPKKTFFFTRFQLNTLEFGKLKNQAWHSGPVEDIPTAFRYFLDFECTEMTKDEARKKVTIGD